MRRVAALAAGLVGCEGVQAPADFDVLTCPADGEVRVLSGGFIDGTEGVAISPDGAAYVTANDQLVRVTPSGDVSPLATLRGLVGAVWWRDAVWVGSWEDDAGLPAPAVVRVTPEGEVARHPVGAAVKPNGFAPTPWGTLLFSDNLGDVIYELDGGGVVSTWSTGVPSPNGLAFSPDGGTLYAASTFREPGLWSVPVEEQAAGQAVQEVDFGAGTVPDGLAVARDGSVYVALNIAQKVVRWNRERVVDVAELTSPASLAFGRGDRDACTLVVTSLFGTDLYEVVVDRVGSYPAWEAP